MTAPETSYSNEFPQNNPSSVNEETRSDAESLAMPIIEENTEGHAFYQAPTRPVSLLYRVLFSLAAIVMGVNNVTIKQLLLPAQVAHLDPTHKIVHLH